MKRFVLVLITILFFNSFAESETASITNQSLRSLKKADDENNAKCDSLKVNPKCTDSLNFMQNVLGLNVHNCEVQKAAAHCAEFAKTFPQYRQMRCEPFEVCKLGLTRTAAEGCKRFGIKVADTVVNAIQAEENCLSNIGCSTQQFLHGMQMVLFPAQAMTSFGEKAAVHLVTTVSDDVKKFKSLACLEPETQLEFACYLAVQYGGAIVLGAGGATALVGRMSALEEVLTVAEIEGATSDAELTLAQNAKSAVDPQALSKLNDYINRNDVVDLHADVELKIVKGRGYLKVNSLSNKDTKLLVLINRAVKSGQISEINAGYVVGPKVLKVLTRLKAVAPEGKALKVFGSLDSNDLDQAVARATDKKVARRTETFKQNDISDYQAAKQELKIEEACHRLFGGARCSRMSFEMDVRHPEQVIWKKFGAFGI